MNRFVDLLNRLRQQAAPDGLTPSQRAARALLLERLGFLDEVNLWGGHGVGKTYLGWVLARHDGADVLPRLEWLEATEPASVRGLVVVDNHGWRRSEVRDALHACRSQGYRKIVLITGEPVEEQMPAVELELTTADLDQVAANLRQIGALPYSDSPRSLWDLVCPVALAE